MTIPIFESEDTVQFTWTADVIPDSAPNLGIIEPFSLTTIFSAVSIASGTAEFYQFFTMPTSLGIYLFEWRAQKTITGSTYPYVDRGCFRIEQTQIAQHV